MGRLVTLLPPFVTHIVVLSEETDVSPGQLLAWAQSTGEPLELKETCYGLMIQGEEDAVYNALKKIRRKAPYEVFSKERAFCIGDRSRCRNGRRGGWSGTSRPGFHQLERESRLLSIVGRALKAVDACEEIAGEVRLPNRIDEEALRSIVNKVLEEE